MKKGRLEKLTVFLVAVVFVFQQFVAYAAPPNEPSLIRHLTKLGKVPKNSSQTEIQRILRSYLMQKGITSKVTDPGNPLAARRAMKSEEKGPATAPGFQLSKTNYYNALVILVEFAGNEGGIDGPLHNQIPPPPEGDNTTFWVSDFNREHYMNMLFSRKFGVKSLANYYYEQSGGTYTLRGYVTDWIKVPHSEWYYGADGEGIDDLNGPVWRIVVDAVQVLGDSINWNNFDKEDPYDLDGDGVTNEPDGYIDHVIIIHAGAGQEAGGGEQGDDAIWSHSWWVDFGSGKGPYGLGGVRCGTSNKWIGPYTIQPEDGTVGVFAHEFGHDLGLPDVYDTLYTGEESAGFWTLMSSGSWLGDKGKALGTSPSSMSIWEKYILGYAEPTVIDYGSRRLVNIQRTNSLGTKGKAVRINLPDYRYSFDINEPYSGNYEWWSGDGDMIDTTLVLKDEFDLTSALEAALEFYAWYDIEDDWDYAYIEVFDGRAWVPVEGNITTQEDPYGNNMGHGITGTSGGWIRAVFDLSDFAGKKIKVRFRYVTDHYINYAGMCVDDICVKVDGQTVFFDDVESGNPGHIANGWKVINGSYEKTASHYYMLEYRTPTGFDTSMLNWYNFVDYETGYAEFFEANPGVLMWYRNTRYSENWVGFHPWEGFLLLVDSHPQLVKASGSSSLAHLLYGYDVELPFRTRIQLYDAAFSLKPAKPQNISSWYGYMFPTTLPSLPPVKEFDDSRTYVDTTYYDIAKVNNDPYFYWDVVTYSMSSVLTPRYGVKWYLRGIDSNRAVVNIINSK